MTNGNRKRRWGRWVLLGFGVLIASAVLAYWHWSSTVEARLQQEIAAIQARGEPIWPEDFNRPPIPDEQNAAIEYKAAAAAIVRSVSLDKVTSREGFYRVTQFIRANPDAIARALAENTEALQLLRAARSKSDVNWGTHFTSPMRFFDMWAAGLSDCRIMVAMAGAQAYWQHLQSDDAGAIETVRDSLALAEAVGRDPALANIVLSSSLAQMTSSQVENIFADLRITNSPVDGLASRQQVSALIGALLDDSEQARRRTWAIYCTRASSLALCSGLLSGTNLAGLLSSTNLESQMPSPTAYENLQSLWEKPLLRARMVDVLEETKQFVEASRQPNLPAAKAMILPRPQRNWLGRIRYEMADMLEPPDGRVIVFSFQGQALRRMAAVALAIRMYEVDHGSRPATLEMLVPEYLPVLPADPFRADGGTFVYRPGGDKPMLYSVGSNGVDDGGVHGFNNHDHVFSLDGVPMEDVERTVYPDEPEDGDVPATTQQADEPVSPDSAPATGAE